MGAHFCVSNNNDQSEDNNEMDTNDSSLNDDKANLMFFTVTTQDSKVRIPLNITTMPDFFGEAQTVQMKPLIQYFEEEKWVRMDDSNNSKLLDVIKKLQNIAQGNTENKENINEDESEAIYEHLIAIIERRLQRNVLDFGSLNGWDKLTVEHLWEIGDIVTYFGEFIYTEEIINGMFALGQSWLELVPSHHVKDKNGDWIGGFVHILQYIECQAQLEDDEENKKELLGKFNALRDGAFDKILEYLKMDPIHLGDNKSFKNHLMFLSINAFEFIKDEWSQIKELAIKALDQLGEILNTKYQEEKWADSIGNVEIVKPFRSGMRQDDIKVHGECEWYIDGDMKFPDAGKLEQHCTEIGLDYNGLLNDENEEVYFTAELPSQNVYIYFLRAIASKVNDEFQSIIQETFGDWVSSAKIKGDSRMGDKVATNYKDKKVPKGAHILDVVRCLISCPTTDDVLNVYKKCCEIFTAVRVKNGFARDADIEFGYRTVFVNVLFESKDSKTRHICEVQITLDDVVHVRHYMHMFYKFRRAQEPENLL